jgi:gliding motility-associated-like protein
MKKIFSILLYLFLITISSSHGQSKIDWQQYDQKKRAGTLNMSDLLKVGKQLKKENAQPMNTKIGSQSAHTQSTSAQCDCLIPLDSSFSIAPFTNGTAPDYRNDDGSTGNIPIPFNFCLYGQTFNSLWINNNGNISFDGPYFTYNASGFPVNGNAMVAAFWGDVDTRDPASGLVYYKITPTSVIVRWERVGYFANHSDLLNDFQIIITDGNDPLIPNGQNVALCYGEMQWTTGDASQGTGGFGGTPATVGANNGNGVDFIQYGRFDQPGAAYDGPFGVNDGIDFLDSKTLIFNSCVSGANIPPLVEGTNVCDTLIICVSDSNFSDTVTFGFNFYPPEPGQNTTIIATGPPGFNVTSNTPGAIASITGYQVVNLSTFTQANIQILAIDDGAPAETTTVTLAFVIDTFGLRPPLPITGTAGAYCAGQPGVTLTAPPGFNEYFWNPTTSTATSILATEGTYNVEYTNENGCRLKSPPFPVFLSDPIAEIGGITAVCGQSDAVLQLSNPFETYNWSNGDTTPAITVGTGTYFVTVTDSVGCTENSDTITVNISNNPIANFSNLPTTSLPLDTVQFNDLSTITGSTIIAWAWSIDTAVFFNQNPKYVFDEAGTYPISLIVVTADGCRDTITIDYKVEPNVVIPFNVFTPGNGDGKNEFFVFKNLEFFPGSQLTVFNRWGKKVYENNSYANNWNGTDASEGTYYYVLKIKDRDTLKGTVTILR